MQGKEDLLRLEGIYRKGFGIVPKFVMHDPQLSLESKAIYAYFCALAGNGTKTFPYRDTILRQLGMSKNTYYRHYTPLLRQGYITVERTADKSSANIYTLVSNPKKLAPIPPTGDGNLRFMGLKSKGYGTIPRAVMQDQRLTVKAKGLYAYFCSYCGSGNCAFPRKDHILFHLDISEPTYYKALNLLKELGYLRAVQRKTSGRFAVCDYRLNAFSPTPNICDTINRDANIQDAKKCDAYYNNNPTINNPANTSQSNETGDAMGNLAREYAGRFAPGEDADKLLEEFLPRFKAGIKGRKVRNLPAYLNASLRSFLRERPLRQPSASVGRCASYHLEELERMVDRGVM